MNRFIEEIDFVHAGLQIEVKRGTPIEEADKIAEEVEKRVHAGTKSGFCVIHVDPAESPRKKANQPND